MNRILLISAISLIAIIEVAKANNPKSGTVFTTVAPVDSVRITEIDLIWNEVSRTVREGDFEGYKAVYHEDAVVVFTTRQNKASMSLNVVLEDWKQDFTDVKTGERTNNVEFRFSQRIGSETTAHETGIFYYTSIDRNGKVVANNFIHFEALLVKRNGAWLLLMEYQKSKATKKEWEALK